MDVRHRIDSQPQLVGAHGGRAGTLGQLQGGDHMKSLKHRAELPVRRRPSDAVSSFALTAASRCSLRATSSTAAASYCHPYTCRPYPASHAH